MHRRRHSLARWLTLLAVGCGDEARVTLRETDASTTAPADASARCARSEDCDDGNPCTTDLCVVGNVCDHERVAGCVAPRRCVRATDCDDGLACTRDRCLVSGLCDSVADDSFCPVGARCVPPQGCVGDGVDAGAPADVPATPTDTPALPVDVPNVADAGPPRDAPSPFDAGPPRDVPVAPDVPAAPDVPLVTDAGPDPRSGSYTVVPAASYSCQDEVFETPILSLALASLQLTASPSETVVTWPGAPVTLRGPAIAANAFRVTGTIPNPDCTTLVTLVATFDSTRRFNGTLSLAFAGIGCVLTNCEARSFQVTGTR